MYSQYPLCWISKKSILLSPFFMHLFAFFAGVSHLLAHLWRLRFRHRNCPLVFYLRERNHFRPTTFSVQLSTRFIALLSSRGLLQFGRIWQNWRYTILNCTFFKKSWAFICYLFEINLLKIGWKNCSEFGFGPFCADNLSVLSRMEFWKLYAFWCILDTFDTIWKKGVFGYIWSKLKKTAIRIRLIKFSTFGLKGSFAILLMHRCLFSGVSKCATSIL